MERRPRKSRLRTRLALVAAGASLLLAAPSSASAAVPPFLWQSPADGLKGEGAGRFKSPLGIAADPGSGHVYVTDSDNSRVSEFDAWGRFVKAWGWGVADGSEEPQTCGPGASPPTATCLPGTTGSGPGQFGAPPPAFSFTGGPLGGIAVDAAGDVYVADSENFRIQKFDSEGNFILAFGDEVNETTGGDVCTAASGHVCGRGTAGEGNAQFTQRFGKYLALGPAGTVFVGGLNGTIQEFGADGTFIEKITLEDELGGLAVASLAIDSLGNFYVFPDGPGLPGGDLYKFGPSGVLLATLQNEFEVEYFDDLFEADMTMVAKFPPQAPLAVDEEDNLYTTVAYSTNGKGTEIDELVKYDSDGEVLVGPGEGFAAAQAAGKSGIVIYALATNTVTAAGGTDVYAAILNATEFGFVAAYGPPPDKWAPPLAGPEIAEQYAVAADPDAATLRASINPKFWADTSYRVEYGTGKCSEGGCPTLTAETQLGAGVVNAFKTTAQVALPDLEPETTYHYRFVAESDGGGPVYGVAPQGGEATAADGLEGTFTTPAPPAPLPATDPCSNAPFRFGPSAFLPDCRAYEMVSPVDKDGGDIFHLFSGINEPIHYNQSTPGGEKIAYTAARAFGDAKSAPAMTHYVASREAGKGWGTEAISPPRGTTYRGAGSTLETQYRVFSEDLCQGWLVHDTDPPLTADAVTGYANIYKANLCGGEPTYEAVTRVGPAGTDPKFYILQVQASADGAVTVFAANGQLEVDAGPKAAPEIPKVIKLQCYQLLEGRLRLVSVLPNGLANPTECSIGLGSEILENPRGPNLDSAVSEDGSRIYWSAKSSGGDQGTIYLRIDGKNPTLAVSAGGEAASGLTENSRFLAATPDGSKAIYLVGNPSAGAADLYEYDLATQTSTPIAAKVRGIVGASEDLGRIYLVSREALAAGASAGEENLYLYEAGAGFRFIGALSAYDAKPRPELVPSATSLKPSLHAARLTDDGTVAVFLSTAPLTGYDNTDAESGEADTEVFRYDATADGGAGRLECVSCNPTGVRPSGRKFGYPLSPTFWAAAKIPGHEIATYPSRVLSEDGSRLFFESFEALTPRDTNSKLDVYEWQEAGTGGCTLSSPDYSLPNGGCLSLISSGKSPEDSSFVDASAEGEDVFFATSSSLLPQDPGLIDIYDARVDGGFPQPTPTAPCQGEACQGAAQSPADITPGSASFVGPPDPVAKQRARRCPKGKRRVRRGGKVRCIPRKANKRGRAGR